MIFSAFISSSRGSNILLYIHHFRDYYYACDSDSDDDDDNHNVIFLSQSLVPLKYFPKLSKQFLYYCLIIKLKFFHQGRGREKLHDLHYLEAIHSTLLLLLRGSHTSLEKSLNFRGSP